MYLLKSTALKTGVYNYFIVKFMMSTSVKSKLWGLLAVVLCVALAPLAHAQLRRGENKAVTYEQYYDDPDNINTLFVMFQPAYGELFVGNVNLGFGMEVQYHMKKDKKFDFRAHARKVYSRKFDFERDVAEKNSTLDNLPNIFNYFEGGITYRVKDFTESGTTRLILISKSRRKKWAALVPQHIVVPAQVRKIYGARLGGFAYTTTTDLDRLIEEDGVVLADSLGNMLATSNDQSLFLNLQAQGVYVGASLSIIRNIAVKPDRNYSPTVNDLIWNAYFDVLIAPSISVDDPIQNGIPFSAENVELSQIGARLGMEGKFNRELGWAYNAEIGMRPSVTGRSFYALVKVSFPVYSSEQNYEKEAFSR